MAGIATASLAATVAEAGGAVADAPVGPSLVPAQAVATANVSSLSDVPPSTLTDGYAASAGDRILLTAQSDPVQNGPWLVAGGAWSRPPDFASGLPVDTREILVAGGATYAGSLWVLPLTAPIVVDTDAEAWQLPPVEPGQLPRSAVLADQANVFSAPQTISHNQKAYGLLINKTTDTNNALAMNFAGNGLGMTMTTDWSANLTGDNTWDSVDIIHRSNGDGIFVCHVGGIPPEYSGSPPGANAALNVLVPYWLDDLSQGTGTIVNTRNGQSGLLISSLATGSGVYGINLAHGGGQAALQITNQRTDSRKNPAVGGGPAVAIADHSKTFSVGIVRHAAPVRGSAAIQIFSSLGVPVFAAVSGSTGGGEKGFTINTDGTATFGPLTVYNGGSGAALTIFAQPGAQGNYPVYVSGQDYGPYIASVSNGGQTLTVAKKGTGSGAAVLVQNRGTGPSIDVQVGSPPTSAFQVLANGQVRFALAVNEATGGGSAALGTNCPARTATSPYVWEKVTTSDGSQGYIPIWK